MSIAMNEHTAKVFDADLQELTAMIAEMGGHTEKQIIEAIEALSRGDAIRGKRVISADAALDALQREIDQAAIATIGTRQHIATNLREIIGIIRIANDLERIGDLAKNIGKRVIGINGEDVPRKAIRGVEHMGALVLRQLQEVLDCFASRDSAKAFDIWNGDEEIDSMNTSLFREVLTYMMEDPRGMAFGIHLLFCAKNIERMGDHVTNIAEALYFMVEGQMLLDERPKGDSTSLLSVAFHA
jgi:phosphate transport system protein